MNEGLLQDVLGRLQRATNRAPVKRGSDWQCVCPAHADDSPSLCVKAGEKGIVLYCFAGCTVEEVCGQLGLTPADLFYEKSSPDSSPAGRPHIPPNQQDDAREGDRRALRGNASDAGNAERLATRHADTLRYDHAQGRWLIWRGDWWSPDTEGELTTLALSEVERRYQEARTLPDAEARAESQWALRSRGRGRIEAAIKIAQDLPPLRDPGTGWDADPWLLGVGNGVVDLRTGELQDGVPEQKITMHTEAAYDPEAEAPRWERFMDEVFNGEAELISFMQRALGYSATGCTKEQCLFMCYGTGANGKGSLFESVRHVLGSYAYDAGFSTLEMSARASVPADLAALVGKRFVTASETNEGNRLNEARIKALSGGDTINARKLYQDPFNFLPTCKLFLAVNHKPHVADDSYGFWRRIRLVPFERCFTGADDDKELKATLRDEAEGILAWIVRGAVLWGMEGLAEPDRVNVATAEYANESNPLADWLTARTVCDAEASTRAAVLYADYVDWARGEGLSERETLTLTKWGRLMAGQEFKKSKARAGLSYVGLHLAGAPVQGTLQER